MTYLTTYPSTTELLKIRGSYKKKSGRINILITKKVFLKAPRYMYLQTKHVQCHFPPNTYNNNTAGNVDVAIYYVDHLTDV